MQTLSASSSSTRDFSRRISLYSAATLGGVAGTVCTFESAQAVLVVTPSSISLTDNPTSVPATSLDLNGDTTRDVGLLVVSSSFATAQGMGAASLAGTVGPGGFFYPTVFQAGSAVGSGLAFGANSGGAPNSFGTLVNGTGGGGPGVGNWLGGKDGYLGVKLMVGADEHFGWLHVVWDEGSDSLTINQYAFENVPNAAAAIPEPASLALLALGALGLARRRRKACE